MSLTSIIQILKVNEPRSGTSKEGRPWTMQDAECMTLQDTGELDQVGVLPLPREMMGESAPKPGIYIGSFAMRADMKTRRIGPVLVALNPYVVPPTGKQPATPAAKA